MDQEGLLQGETPIWGWTKTKNHVWGDLLMLGVEDGCCGSGWGVMENLGLHTHVHACKHVCVIWARMWLLCRECKCLWCVTGMQCYSARGCLFYSPSLSMTTAVLWGWGELPKPTARCTVTLMTLMLLAAHIAPRPGPPLPPALQPALVLELQRHKNTFFHATTLTASSFALNWSCLTFISFCEKTKKLKSRPSQGTWTATDLERSSPCQHMAWLI